MDYDYFDRYPALRELFAEMKYRRRNEILSCLKANDKKYAHIVKMRTEQSMVLRRKLKKEIADFEKYMDLVYSQELYELDIVYEQAFMDALEALKKLKILSL